jgi:DNA-binding SARP family transcriptional activator
MLTTVSTVRFCRLILRGQYMSALEIRMSLAQQAGDWHALRDLALRLSGEDPFLEQAHRALMRAHLALGNRGAALSCYDELCKLLLAELGVGPMRETRLLAQALRQQDDMQPSNPQHSKGTPEYVDIPIWLSRIAGEMEAISRALRTV